MLISNFACRTICDKLRRVPQQDSPTLNGYIVAFATWRRPDHANNSHSPSLTSNLNASKRIGRGSGQSALASIASPNASAKPRFLITAEVGHQRSPEAKGSSPNLASALRCESGERHGMSEPRLVVGTGTAAGVGSVVSVPGFLMLEGIKGSKSLKCSIISQIAHKSLDRNR